MNFLLANAHRVVIKLGTGILTKGIGQLETDRIRALCGEIAKLRANKTQVLLVSSGAIGLGMGAIGLRARPTALSSLQACAAIGQTILMETWQKELGRHGLRGAQLLFTRDDLRARHRHVAAKETIERLLSLGVVPIINENDSVSTEEIKFGDNDVLSALVASLTKANMLIILSTIPGLMDLDGDGKVVPVVSTINAGIEAMAGGTTSPTAVGGMRSKIEAAKIATGSGCGVFIGSGYAPALLSQMLEGGAEGTFFIPEATPLVSRKRWLAFFERPSGALTLDPGACDAVVNNGRSLLAKGITAVDGDFPPETAVRLLDPEGRMLAKGMSHYGSGELRGILGKSSAEIRKLFPGRKRSEVIHRDSLVVLV